MNRIGIMQPYFFPYIGYWQLINAVDRFVLLEDVQYMRHSWINRNRLLSTNGGWHFVTISLKKHPREEEIKNIQVSQNFDMKSLIYGSLTVYKNRAPFYQETVDLISHIFEVLEDVNTIYISKINYTIIKEVCNYLKIKTKILVSSERKYDYSNVRLPGDWAFEITKQEGGDEYINPYSGKKLFDPLKFSSCNIKLAFLKPRDLNYDQGEGNFEPWLSIIDVLVFNGREKTISLLKDYDLIGAEDELLERPL